MSLVTVSKKRNRVYYRHFDHDEARRLYAEGWGYGRVAEHFGVTPGAVRRIVDDEYNRKLQNAANAWNHRNLRVPCKGGCGVRIWATDTSRSGYCIRCVAAQKTAPDVRPEELRCTQCREWKPDAAFPTYKTSARISRRGRTAECRSCCARREYRRSHSKQRQAENTKANTKRREKRPMARYIVFQPNGEGFKEVARVDAGSPAHAVETAAKGEGEYVAVPEGRFRVMRVAPVQALRIVEEPNE